MSRVHRLRVADRIFFVTVNLRRSLPPFTAAEYALILESFEESRRRLGFLLCGYVLMPDHWHGLFWPRYPLSISRLVQDIKYASSRRLNRQRGSTGSLWQHQFWDRFVRHAKEFNDRLTYMHLNPVRKALVDRPEEWRWSSYQNFSLEESVRAACPLQVDYVLLPDSYRG
jgi:REP element-mobilizing transposase RayT